MKKNISIIIGIMLLFLLTSCSSTENKTNKNNTVKLKVQPQPEEKEEYEYFQTGAGSWYGKQFQGKETASGEKFNMNELTAAHKTLPFGTIVEVTNLNNGKKVVVRINDRGPFSKKRVLDLSKTAFSKISNTEAGVIPLEIKIVEMPEKKS